MTLHAYLNRFRFAKRSNRAMALSQSCVDSDEATWRLRWKATSQKPLEMAFLGR